jgi:fatty-acyl-CoA synthase
MIVDDDNNPLGPGKKGELVVRGYNVMQGYFKKPKETEEAIDKDNFLHSGDLATVDERGYYRIVGRKKEMYICGGFNVYPREIEEYLFTIDGVENVAVLGVPDPKFGEVGLAAIKVAEGKELTEDDVIGKCKGIWPTSRFPDMSGW